MAIELYFGLPGCGKTTLMAAEAFKAVRYGKYNNVYCNVRLSIPGVTYIDNDCIGRYTLYDGLLLIDEATLFADSRSHKDFTKEKIEFFLLHRHYNLDIKLYTQQWDGVDRKIRVITDRVYYIYKGFILGHWFSTYYRIPYGIIIPEPKHGAGSQLGEIIQGYCKPNILIRLFAPKIFRPAFYKYFDSWEQPRHNPLPSRYNPFFTIVDGEIIDTVFKPTLRHKSIILLRSLRDKTKTFIRRFKQ